MVMLHHHKQDGEHNRVVNYCGYSSHQSFFYWISYGAMSVSNALKNNVLSGVTFCAIGAHASPWYVLN